MGNVADTERLHLKEVYESPEQPSPGVEETPHLRRLLPRIYKFVLISIAAHISGLLIFGGFVIIRRLMPEEEPVFEAPVAMKRVEPKKREYKLRAKQQQQRSSRPKIQQRLQSSRISTVALPKIDTKIAPVMNKVTDIPGLSEALGEGLALGGGVGEMSLFGSIGGSGLVGRFYDFKRDSEGKPTGIRKLDRSFYKKILEKMTSGTSWGPPGSTKYYTSPTSLNATIFFFPAIPDTEAGAAFKSEDTQAGMWVAHYSGRIVSPVFGRYRMVGWGDNLLAVKLDHKTVLDASDIRYLEPSHERVGGVSFPEKTNTPMFHGEWFDLRSGQSMTCDVILGDEGGIFCAGVHIQKEGTTYSKGRGGIPNLPLFMVGEVSPAQKDLYKTYLDSKAFNGPIFKMSH